LTIALLWDFRRLSDRFVDRHGGLFYLRSAVKDVSTFERFNTETSGYTSQHRSREGGPSIQDVGVWCRSFSKNPIENGRRSSRGVRTLPHERREPHLDRSIPALRDRSCLPGSPGDLGEQSRLSIDLASQHTDQLGRLTRVLPAEGHTNASTQGHPKNWRVCQHPRGRGQ